MASMRMHVQPCVPPSSFQLASHDLPVVAIAAPQAPALGGRRRSARRPVRGMESAIGPIDGEADSQPPLMASGRRGRRRNAS